MAKYQDTFTGDIKDFLPFLENGILNGSASASFEDGSDFSQENYFCAVRVFERYSMMGGNRVSLNVTIFGHGDTISLSAITSGGSQAVLFKINTFGEEAFLDCVRDLVSNYKGKLG